MPLVDVSEVSNREFDYIICGGGTAGLTLAARLSADPGVTVLVLEAGNANLDDPAILVPAQYLRQLGDERYDWKFTTTEQEHCKGRRYVWPRGKGLGGSSATNFMAYIRPPAEDVDAWEKLGNPGWNWSNYLKYSKRGERFTAPTEELATIYRHTFEEQYHGTEGELQVCFPPLIMAGEVPYQMSMNNLGIPTLKEPLSGDVNGTWMSAITVDPTTLKRSYAVTAFLEPYLGRKNPVVLTGATVERIGFPDSAPGPRFQILDLKATSVEFWCSGVAHKVLVGREVIICAGTLKSPQILELSGIGAPEVLIPLGIEPLQTVRDVEMDPTKEWQTLDKLRDDNVWAAEQMQLFESKQGIHTLGLAGFTFTPMQQVSSKASEIIAAQCAKLSAFRNDRKIRPGLWEQYKAQMRVLQSENSVDMEWTTLPQFRTFRTQPVQGKQYMTVLVALNHPFSRGSIHIGSKDPHQQPVMNPHYFEDDFDMQLLVEGFKFARKVAETEPFKSCIVREIDPGPAVRTDEEIREYIIEGLMTAFHTVGSCSMLPQELGGVVDHRLKVYGTQNVRVADLSIVPLHIAAHTQATAYAIGEQAADIIIGVI
ncbi:GMC oxidoreductase [Calocera cornea HHB12733]|uniref:GMC oxidoreductase n=1 Tax=Calocera cornea HHB12733 TaxID=1353952 RepID=A0A165CLC1_9BASI|nr:GMC oxidoreductase [Calocera cornea HHB12733]